MKHRLSCALLVAFVIGVSTSLAAHDKPRVIVLTDIENEPDDAQSMVRFLTYANHFDVEGLIATTSVHQRNKIAGWRIREIIEAYGKVRDNLEKHEPGFPSAEQLLSILQQGRPAYGTTAIGDGMDSPGSDLIIAAVDRDDPRPVWVLVWGGPNCLAQALFRARATRPRKWHIEPETRPIWSDAEDEVMGVDGNWHTSNKATIWRWRSAYQNDFAVRMDWTIKTYSEANHPPVPKLDHPSELSAKPGERVDLSAEGSTDPNGDKLSYQWFRYREPGTLTTSNARTGQPLKIEEADKEKAWFVVPTKRVLRNGTMHIILAVTDESVPHMTRYRRVIVDVQP